MLSFQTQQLTKPDKTLDIMGIVCQWKTPEKKCPNEKNQQTSQDDKYYAEKPALQNDFI